MIQNDDKKYLKMAIENAQQSYEKGRFPAGAVVVNEDQVIASEISIAYPGLFHADSNALSKAFDKIGYLKDATLYVVFEPCLMCTGVAYWSGIRRIVYAIPKSMVSGHYYETHAAIKELVDGFNAQIERIHLNDHQESAMQIVKKWEQKYLPKLMRR